MPIPKPRTEEEQDDFIGRCMGDAGMRSEYPEPDQRAAVCHDSWRDRNATSRRPKSAARELAEFLRRGARLFMEASMDLLEDLARVRPTDASRNRLEKVIGETMALADLLGRRRLLLESDFARSSQPRELVDTVVFASEIVPKVPFKEAIADLVGREPRLAATAAEVSELYRRQHAFALARSTEIQITQRVQRIITRAISRGEPKAIETIQQVGGFTRAYAETVYRTNLNTAYTAGRFAQAADPEIAEVMGAFERFSSEDSDVRRGRPIDRGENHQAAAGLVAATRDPVWRFAATPSGYG